MGGTTARSKEANTKVGFGAGPADYNIERVIGKKDVIQSGIASVP